MNSIVIMADCMACGSLQAVDVPEDSWEHYKSDRNVLVQNVFPDLSPDEREILIGEDSGVYHCPPCWDKMIDSLLIEE